MKKLFWVLLIVVIVASVYWFSQLQQYAQTRVTINDTDFIVDVARSIPQQVQGLSDRRVLELHRGMLFVYDDAKERGFWMKDMLIPIDILWIRNREIVGITKDVPYPELGAKDADLPKYFSGVPVDTVLELQGGAADRFGFHEGMRVIIE